MIDRTPEVGERLWAVIKCYGLKASEAWRVERCRVIAAVSLDGRLMVCGSSRPGCYAYILPTNLFESDRWEDAQELSLQLNNAEVDMLALLEKCT